MKKVINIIGILGIIIFAVDQLLHNISLYGDTLYNILMAIGAIMVVPFLVMAFIQGKKEKNSNDQ